MEQCAHQLSKPYLFIGNNKPTKVNNIVDRLRLNTAIRLFKIVYNLDNKKDGALFFAGKCYQALGKNEQALNVFKKIWEQKSFNPILFKELGTSCFKLGKYNEGLQYAQKEVSEYPDNAEAIANLAHFLVKLNRIDEAFQTICRARTLNGQNNFVDQIYGYIESRRKK